jgi:hypothetical protein
MVALASCDVMPQISDIDGDGIADELDNLDDRLVGSWMGSVDLNFESDGNYNANSGSINGTWETRFDTDSDGNPELYWSHNDTWYNYIYTVGNPDTLELIENLVTYSRQ